MIPQPPEPPHHDPGGLPWEQWLTVTQINEQIRTLLEDAFPFVRVRGEISDLHQPPSGHIYFTLVDAQSRIRAVVWRGSRPRLRLVPRAGESVLVTGRVAAYSPRGEYQLVVEGMQSGGGGTERERFLQLFATLQAEGLLADARKKPLPFLPETIGVVTSASGAAIHDIMRVLDTRFPGYHLLLAHARVQGEGAIEEIVAALQGLIADGRAQVIICGRGGGSAEDLAAFNSEAVARAIAASPIPIISAVGHEVDLTLADLVADFRAATPSAAAERVMPEKRVLLANLSDLRQRLLRAALAQVVSYRTQVQMRQQRLLHPRRRLEFFRVRCDDLLQRILSAEQYALVRRRQRLDSVQNRLSLWGRGAFLGLLHTRFRHLSERLNRGIGHHLHRSRQRVVVLESRLHGVSPLAVLQRGYGIIYDSSGRVLRRADTVSVGEQLQIVLAQGALVAVVHSRKEEPCSDISS